MKIYQTPALELIEITSNQAIAACSLISDVNVERIGYRCSWCGASMDDKEASAEHKNNAHGATVPDSDMPYCYNVKQIGGDGFFRWEDFNENGIFDAGDNWQDVHWPGGIEAVFMS